MARQERRSVRYAQNFLKNGNLVARLIDRAGIGTGDTVFEIGPGRGIITERLARRCRRLLAVEKDPVLAATLQRRFADTPHVTIRRGDALSAPLPRGPHKVFASIPFHSTAAIVRRLTTAADPAEEIVLVIQREAAERYLGHPRATLPSALLAPWFTVSVLHHFRRTDFTPAPGVEVVLLRLHKRGPPLIAPEDAPRYRDFVTRAFTGTGGSPAEPLTGVFRGARLAGALAELNLDPHTAPGLIPPCRWPALFAAFRAAAGPHALRRLAGASRQLQRHQARLQKSHRTRVASPRPAVSLVVRR